MNVNPKTYLTVRMFKAAFMVKEAGGKRQLATYMAQSLGSGFKGFRAIGRTQKKGFALYTLESFFEVCRLMGASCFEGGVLPVTSRHIAPRAEMMFDEFMAVLFLHGNDIEFNSDNEKYRALCNAAQHCRSVKSKGRFNFYVYEALANAARRCGYDTPVLPHRVVPPHPVCVLRDTRREIDGAELPPPARQVTQGELPWSELAERYEKNATAEDEFMAESREFRKELLAEARETNRLLRELLAERKGGKR